MHAVIYKFIVKEDKVEQLLESWLDLTKLIYQYEGSLGSRIHKVSEQEYIAYAQWPSKEILDAAGDHLPEEVTNLVRKKMRASCISIDTLYEMEVIEDYLQQGTYQTI